MSRLPRNLGRLDEKSGLPLYQQLQRLLKGAIERNVIAANDALPPERDLASELDVSRITVRKAIDGLVAEGLLVRRQGSGTFVKARVEKNFSQLSSFSEDMRARGLHPRSVWLKRSQGTVTPGRGADDAISARERPCFACTASASRTKRRWRSNMRLSSHPACLPWKASTHRCTRLSRQSGNRPVKALQRLRAVLLTTEQAKLLGAKDLDAGLLAERVGYLADGRAVEFSQSFYRGDTYDFVAELSVQT